MSTCDQKPAGGWTFDTLRAHLLGIMDERDKRYDQRFEASQSGIQTALAAVKEAGSTALSAADRAVAKAENASERRFESINEFRAALSDQQRTLIPRVEADLRFTALEASVRSLVESDKLAAGRGIGTANGWGYAIGAAGFVFGLIGLAIALVKIFKG